MPARKLTVRPSYIQVPADQPLFDFESLELKCCKQCGESKIRDLFHRDIRVLDGRQGVCKQCSSDRQSSAKFKARKALEAQGLKECVACKQVKPLDAFHINSQQRHRRMPRCRECTARDVRLSRAADPEKYRQEQRDRRRKYPEKNKEAQKKYRLANWDAMLENVRRWRSNNLEKVRAQARDRYRKDPSKHIDSEQRRRARKKDSATSPFTLDDLKSKMAYWGDRCWMCGGDAEAIDHVKPLSKGGPHILANLRPACKSCNSSKRDKWPIPNKLKGY